MKKWTRISLIILTIIALGSLREVFFVNINNQIAFDSGNLDANYLVSYLSFLEHYSVKTLSMLKWLLTLVFTFLFWLSGFWLLKKILKQDIAARYYTGSYIIFFVLAGSIYLLGLLINAQSTAYQLSRGIMGGLQSPIPLIIILPALLLKKSS